jgi:uncharacterized protein YdaU (DUF1376 family)
MKEKGLVMLPLFPRDFIAATLGWTLEQRGLYLMLMFAEWELGSLPPDEETLANVAGASLPDFARPWARVKSKFVPRGDGNLVNERLEAHRGTSLHLKEVRAIAGKLGGKAKAKKLAKRSANGLAETYPPSPSPSPSLSPSPSPAFNPSSIAGLDQEAWAVWIEYRRLRKPAIKPFSMEAAAREMAALGAGQKAAVEHTKANGWQGLVEPRAGAKKAGVVPRTVAQMEADLEDENAKRGTG